MWRFRVKRLFVVRRVFSVACKEHREKCQLAEKGHCMVVDYSLASVRSLWLCG